MLDVSNNNLKEMPPNIHELNNLSVLNISGNLGNLKLTHQQQSYITGVNLNLKYALVYF